MNFWTFLTENIPAMLIPIGTISGAFLGAFISSSTQRNVISKQLEWDKIKLRNTQLDEALSLYNKVLEVSGTSYVIEFNRGNFMEINLGTYNQRIRPILFEKFHLLHEDVAIIVLEMDNLIERCNFEEELSHEDSEYLAIKYLEIIDNIKVHIQQYRNDNMN